MAHDDEKSIIAKYGLLAIFIMIGATTQVLLSNQKKRLNWWQNAAIFLSCCLVGGTWAIYYDGHTNMLALTGFVSAMGYNVTKAVLLMVKDPEILKQIIKDRANRL